MVWNGYTNRKVQRSISGSRHHLRGEKNERVGIVYYDTLKCGGDLFLIAVTATRITLDERITSGLSNCLDRSVITLTSNGRAVDYNAHNVLAGDVSATAILKKRLTEYFFEIGQTSSEPLEPGVFPGWARNGCCGRCGKK